MQQHLLFSYFTLLTRFQLQNLIFMHYFHTTGNQCRERRARRICSYIKLRSQHLNAGSFKFHQKGTQTILCNFKIGFSRQIYFSFIPKNIRKTKGRFGIQVYPCPIGQNQSIFSTTRNNNFMETLRHFFLLNDSTELQSL